MGAPGALELLGNKSVIDELKLSDEQQEKLKKVSTELREKNSEAMKDAFKDKAFDKIQTLNKEMNATFAKTVEGTLKPEQVKRLHQIEVWVSVQRSGPAVFSQERVEKEIKLTDKQKEQDQGGRRRADQGPHRGVQGHRSAGSREIPGSTEENADQVPGSHGEILR